MDGAVGRIGQPACWEHYQPLARYALIADGEQIHAAMFPGGLGAEKFTDQMQIAIRQHALESASFVVNATAWLDENQRTKLAEDTGGPIAAFSGGFFTAIADPEGRIVGQPLTAGEGEVIADLDFALIDRRKRMADTIGHSTVPQGSFSTNAARKPPPAPPGRPRTSTPPAPSKALGQVQVVAGDGYHLYLVTLRSDIPARGGQARAPGTGGYCRTHFRSLPPLQFGMLTAVPLAVPAPMPSRHSPDSAAGTVPTLLSRRCWSGTAVTVPDVQLGAAGPVGSGHVQRTV